MIKVRHIHRKKKNSNYFITVTIDDINKSASLYTKDVSEARQLRNKIENAIASNYIYSLDSLKNYIITNTDPNKKSDSDDKKRITDRMILNDLGLTKKVVVHAESSLDALTNIKNFTQEMENIGFSLANVNYEKHSDRDGIENYAKIFATYKFNRVVLKKIYDIVTTVTNIDPNKNYKYLILQDFHIPYHHKKAINSVLKMSIDNNFYGICVNGDVVDLEFMSSYTKSQATLGIQYIMDVINEAGELLHFIENAPFKERVFIEGNHDERISRDIFGVGTSGVGITPYGKTSNFYSIANLLSLDENKWILKRYREKHKIGDFYVHHGEEYGASVNTHHIKENTVMGHVHRPETIYGYKVLENGIKETLTSIRGGCMVDLTSDIPIARKNMINTWNNGFVVLNVINGKAYPENILIQNNEYFYNGKLYKIE